MTALTLDDLKKFTLERDAEFQKALTSSVTNAVLTSVDKKLDEKLPGILDTVNNVVARTENLEKAAAHDYEVNKVRLLQEAKREFQATTREMFDESGLILTSPRQTSSRHPSGTSSEATAVTPAPSAETRAAVLAYVESVVGPGKYTVNSVKNGLRLVHTSRSSQDRRASAELLLPHRAAFRSRFNLSLQLDRPYALRQLVRHAYAFLDGAKRSCSQITKVGVSKGLCYVNSLPIGPIWLVPRKGMWHDMYDVISRDFGLLPPTADEIDSDGYFASLFAQAFVSDAGLRVLPTVPSN
jgi:hypothetical protein